jgi:hypothetical protein
MLLDGIGAAERGPPGGENSRCEAGAKTGKAEPLRAPPPCAMSSLTPVRDDWSASRDLSVSGSRAGLEGRPSSGSVSWPMALCLASRCYDGVPALAGPVPQSADETTAREAPPAPPDGTSATPIGRGPLHHWSLPPLAAHGCGRPRAALPREFSEPPPMPSDFSSSTVRNPVRSQVRSYMSTAGRERRGEAYPHNPPMAGSIVDGPVRRETLPLAEKLAMLVPAR